MLNELRHRLVNICLLSVLSLVPKDRDGVRLVQALFNWADHPKERIAERLAPPPAPAPPWAESNRPGWLPPGAPWAAPTRRVAELADYGTDPTWPREHSFGLVRDGAHAEDEIR